MLNKISYLIPVTIKLSYIVYKISSIKISYIAYILHDNLDINIIRICDVLGGFMPRFQNTITMF